MAVLSPGNNRWFEVGLLSLLQLVLFGLFAGLTFTFGAFIILAPALVVAAVLVLCKRFEIAVLILLASSTLFLENVEGINTLELIYFTIVMLVFAVFPGTNILRGRLHFPTRLDRLAVLFVLLLAYGIVLGMINGGRPALVIGEVLYYFGFIGFFAYRNYLHKPWFQKAFLAVFVLILLFVAVRNIFYYREILLAAYAEWQAQKARTAANEVLLVTGALGSVSFVLYAQKWYSKIAGIALLALFVGDLIITQSRGYWLAFVFGLAGMWLIAERKVKLRIMGFGSIVILTGIITGYWFFNDLFNLVLKGLENRMNSLFALGSGGLDVSLQERLLESKTVVQKIMQNPIAGYGFGVTFSRYFFLPQIFQDYSYVHNGYLAIWYKLGLLGLITILWYCGHLLKSSYKLYKANISPVNNMIFFTIFGTLTAMLLVNNTSPQFLSFDGMLLLGLMGAYCATQAENYNNHLTLT